MKDILFYFLIGFILASFGVNIFLIAIICGVIASLKDDFKAVPQN